MNDTVIAAAVGALAGGAGQAFIKLVELWISRRADVESEQKKVARDLLLLVEKFCRECDGHERKPRADPADLNLIKDEIAVRSVELSNATARSHMSDLDGAFWFAVDPTVAKYSQHGVHFTTYPISTAAREVLGSIIRGEKVPVEMPAVVRPLLTAAKEADEYLTHLINSQEEYEREKSAGQLSAASD